MRPTFFELFKRGFVEGLLLHRDVILAPFLVCEDFVRGKTRWGRPLADAEPSKEQ